MSAGNTGAMVAGGLRLRRFLKNVRRPGIAAVMPTLRGPCVLIDVGANVSPKPNHLFQYGVMGSIFIRHVMQRGKPTIGLMNVGAEEQKGHDLAKETHALFKDFVKTQRPTLDVSVVANGEYWLGRRAKELGLVDELGTSDDYLLARVSQANLFGVRFRPSAPWRERLGDYVLTALARLQSLTLR